LEENIILLSELVVMPYVVVEIYFTGSLLVACAHHGGFVAGADIDYNLLLGIGILCSNYTC
jgi:hypothetical protein